MEKTSLREQRKDIAITPWYVITLDDLLPFFSLLLFLVSPELITPSEFRTIETEMKVGFDRFAPPFAAFVDEAIPQIEKPNLPELKTKIRLVAGTHSTTNYVNSVLGAREQKALADYLFSKNLIRKKQLEREKKPRIVFKSIQLEPMTVAKSDIFESPRLPKPVLAEKTRSSVAQLRAPVSSSFAARWSDYQTENDLNELIVSTKPHFPSDAKEFTSGTQVDPVQSVEKGKWVGPIYVAKNNKNAAVPPNQSTEREVPSRGTHKKSTQKQEDKSRVASNDALPEKESEKAPASLVSLVPNQFSIMGQINLNDGLAFFGKNESMKIYWRVGDHVEAEAKIDMNSGSYEIQIPNSSMGSLVAEVRGPSGGLLAFNETLISEIGDGVQPYEKVEYNLSLKPDSHDALGTLALVGKDLKLTTISSANLFVSTSDIVQKVVNTKFTIKKLFKGSHFLGRLTKHDLWKALFVGSSSTKNSIPATSLLSKLGPVSGFDVYDFSQGIIWGQVLDQGVPVKGASVELSHSPAKGPYYLNDDGTFSLSPVTTENGYFVYVDAPESTYLIRARIAGKATRPEMVKVSEGYVSTLNIEKTEKKNAELFVFDTISGEPLMFNARFLGEDDSVEATAGVLDLKFYNTSDTLQLEVRTTDPGYFPTVASFSRGQVSMNAGIPTRSWINELASENRITLHPGKGIIMGRVKGSNFRVDLPKEMSDAKIVYFDRDGHFIDSSELGLPGIKGGGFIVFNVEEGMHDVSIYSNIHQKSASKIIYSLPDSVSTFQQRF